MMMIVRLCDVCRIDFLSSHLRFVLLCDDDQLLAFTPISRVSELNYFEQ